MSAKQPEIKFSPFEALLIGEKNRVLKRQPMKNTIFVTRLNQKCKAINLRALFGLERYTISSRSNDEIFKMPPRVHEFINYKKQGYENNKITENKGDRLYHEFKGQRMFAKNNDCVKPKYKKSKTKSNKFKFKKKFNRNGNGKVVSKFHYALRDHSTIKKYNLSKRNNGMLKEGCQRMCANRYSLRGKDSNFTYETQYEDLQSKEANTNIKQDYSSNYMCKFLMDNYKNIFNNDNQIENGKESYMSKWDEQFDLSDLDTILNELLKQNYYYNDGFEFPKCPETGISDFDDDENLVDIIYEDFPKSLQFESNDSSTDFIDALINAEIIKPVMDVETSVTEVEVLEQGQKIKVSCGTQTSSMDLPRPIDLSSCYHLQALRSGYIATTDRFTAMQNHLISDENFGGLYLNNSNVHNKNDLVMTSLMKPILHNPWVGSLQNF